MDPVIEPSAWSAPVLRSESQRRPGRVIELKIVGELRDVRSPRASTEARRRSAPKSAAGWQLAQAVLPSSDTRVSQKRERPSSTSGVASFAFTGASTRPKSSSAIFRSSASSPARQIRGSAANNSTVVRFMVFLPCFSGSNGR
jgi:hypothetical protein